jgi:hypothetical protein
MIKQTFQIEFLDDIVLNSNSATTMGLGDTLDYIPGSALLGITANNNSYKEFKNSFETFHSGKVRFGDGHILSGNNYSYKIPFSYFINKGENLKEAKIYHHHKLTDDERDKLKSEGIQLKQVRNGYFDKNFNLVELKFDYTQKSAFENRRSKKSYMYGYKAIKRGAKFGFEISCENEELLDEVVQKLDNKIHRLGKSKNNQFGRIKIKVDNSIDTEIKQKPLLDSNIILLYAKSNLALIENDGHFVATPTISSLKLPNNSEIDFKKSQIRTRVYSPYNSTRKRRDYERVIIEKGSVIAVSFNGDFDLQQYQKEIENGVGAYLSEGFGEIIINPSFLYDEVDFKEQKNSSKILGIDIKDNSNSNLVSYLQNQKEKKEIDKKLIEKAYKNRDKFSKNTTSQWGVVRQIASITSDDKIIAELEEKLSKGVAKDKWKDDLPKLIKLLNDIEQKSRFLKLLSMEVSRYLKGVK